MENLDPFDYLFSLLNSARAAFILIITFDTRLSYKLLPLPTKDVCTVHLVKYFGAIIPTERLV